MQVRSPFTIAELDAMAEEDKWRRAEASRIERAEAYQALREVLGPARKKKKKKKPRGRRLTLNLTTLSEGEWWQLEGLRERRLRNKFIIIAIKEGLRRISDAAKR